MPLFNPVGTINGNQTVNGQFAVATGSTPALQITGSSNGQDLYTANGNDTTTHAFKGQVTGDGNARYTVGVGGDAQWGNGTLARDTTLARTAAGVLTASGLAVTNLLTPNGGTATAGSAPALTPTFANGVASQLTDTTRDYLVYLQIGTAGTAFTLAIGPTSTPANTLMASATPLADELLSFRLPAGWYVKWAGTSTTLTTQTAIGC